MQKKFIAYYKGKQEVSLSFCGKNMSSDGSLILLNKIERKRKIIKSFSQAVEDKRDSRYITHSVDKIMKQRVFAMILGYQDANDEKELRKDTIFQEMLEGDLVSQPTISRLENQADRHQIYNLSEVFLERYIKSLKGRKSITIDVDATDDPTHGNQQQSLFNGYYYQFMYNELLFFDGETQQLILPVLRPGNSHSNKWHVPILKRIITRIRDKYPSMEIYIRADSGFSQPEFYELARAHHLYYCVGIARNPRLSAYTARFEKRINKHFGIPGIKYQYFTEPFDYQAGTWLQPEKCYAKIESTGRGMNVRYFISNFPSQKAREIYFGFYVKRADTCENRIKELKNMCYSDRLSDHRFWANYFRLILSAIVYDFFIEIKKGIKETDHEKAYYWQVDTIRQKLLKVAATIKLTKRRIMIDMAEAFVYKDIFASLVVQ